MSEMRKAKLFKKGSTQNVRLPADFSFEGSEVYITRDEHSGDVVLSSRLGTYTWSDFFELMKTIDVPPEFMAERPLNAPPSERPLFADAFRDAVIR